MCVCVHYTGTLIIPKKMPTYQTCRLSIKRGYMRNTIIHIPRESKAMEGDTKCINGFYVGLVVMLYAFTVIVQLEAASETKTCFVRKSPCFLKKQTCPKQCPSFSPPSGSSKACVIDCFNPICKATCRSK